MAQQTPAKWFESLPTPKSSPRQISVDELHGLLHGSEAAEVLVVDVRGADIEDPLSVVLPNAINLPAQTFYQTLPTLLPILQRYSDVVFHCSSSQGRGPRCAGWYTDALEEKGLKVNSHVLTGGIKAWVEKYSEEVTKI